MNQDLTDVINSCYEKKLYGTDISEIRKELKTKNYDEKTISEIVKIVDNMLLNVELYKSKKIGSREIAIIGYLLFLEVLY